jgi:hypothetical protein
VLDTTTIAALGGLTGLALLVKELVSAMAAVRSGVSAREGKRKSDIVQQRDEALARADRETSRADRESARADDEAVKRRVADEYAARLRLQLVKNGIDPGDAPVVERTIPKA